MRCARSGGGMRDGGAREERAKNAEAKGASSQSQEVLHVQAGVSAARRGRKEKGTHVGHPPRDERLSCPRRRVELKAIRSPNRVSERATTGSGRRNVQGVLHVFVDLHDGGLVAAAVAVVGCREDGDDVAVVRPVAASFRHMNVSMHASCATGTRRAE